jgi:hypothetical protein
MSSFTYHGPRNVLCTPASMSTDVHIQPTPEPTPIVGLLPKQGKYSTNHDNLPDFMEESSVGADSFRPQYRGLPRETNPQTDPDLTLIRPLTRNERTRPSLNHNDLRCHSVCARQPVSARLVTAPGTALVLRAGPASSGGNPDRLLRTRGPRHQVRVDAESERHEPVSTDGGSSGRHVRIMSYFGPRARDTRAITSARAVAPRNRKPGAPAARATAGPMRAVPRRSRDTENGGVLLCAEPATRTAPRIEDSRQCDHLPRSRKFRTSGSRKLAGDKASKLFVVVEAASRAMVLTAESELNQSWLRLTDFLPGHEVRLVRRSINRPVWTSRASNALLTARWQKPESSLSRC